MTKQEMLYLKLQGQTYRAIGKLAGISRQRVQQLLAPPRAIREIVVKRVNGLCQRCQLYVGKSGHVHHKGSTTEEDFNDLDNLELLCPSCHRNEHPITVEQKERKPVMFYLTEEQKEQLWRIAREQGRTLSEIMRRSIDEIIAREHRLPRVEKERRAE